MTPDQIDHIVDAYTFTPDDKAALTSLMAAAYLHAKQAAYQRAHTTAGHRISIPAWRPGDADATQAHDWAYERAAGIAETYEGLLRSQLEQMQESTIQEGIGDWARGVVQRITDWFSQFLPWKTEQIADDTWLEGNNDGTEQFVDDVRQGGTDYSMLQVRVEPGDSSSDFCADYAGNIYPFDAVGSDLPEFPAHSRCIHYLVVVNSEGDEVSV